MIYGERTNRAAYHIVDGVAQKMQRVPFMSGYFNEAWLQELLEKTPALIPSGEVSVEYTPLLCIGREVPVGSGDTKGYIDNLYLAPSGHIVIVETKLFRNQESRRTVVAQVIDYAKELQQWDAEQLNAVAEDYFYRRDGQALCLIDAMAKAGYLTLSDEAELNDSINRHLSSAAFLLLIIGDGIRSNVLQLAEFLNENTSMAFNLALAEMEIYQHDDGSVIVIPNLLTKTTVIERRQLSAGGTSSAPTGQSSTPSVRIPYTSKPLLSRREFIETFASRGGYDPDLVTEFLYDMERVGGMSITITPTELHIDLSLGGSKRATVLYFGISGNIEASIYMRPDRMRDQMVAGGRFPTEADDFLEFYKSYINLSKCKAAPYEFGANRFYYAKVGAVLENSAKFVGAAEALASKIAGK